MVASRVWQLEQEEMGVGAERDVSKGGLLLSMCVICLCGFMSSVSVLDRCYV